MSDARQHRDSVDDRPTIEHHPDERTGTVTPGATRGDTRGDTYDETRRDTYDATDATRGDASDETHRDTRTAAMPATGVRTVREPDRARGGFSFWSVLSGVLVAFGSFIILVAIIGAIFAATGIAEGGISATEVADAGIGAAIGLILAQFLAYLWGGYTAGRMARGSGVLNGILVPIMAVILVAIVGGIVAALMANAGVEPDTAALPLPLSELSDIGTVAGIGALIAMLLGGALGGAMGARWHTKLEDRETVVETR